MNHDDQELGREDEGVIGAFMRRVASVPPPAGWSLPPVDRVLRQAQWRRRWEGERQMHVPLDLVWPLQIAAGLAALGLLMFRAIPLLAVTLQSAF